MRKLIAITFVLGVLAVGIAVARATPMTEIMITQHPVAAATVVGGQPDVLGLDLTIAAPRGDVLDALTVAQSGTAAWQQDLAALALWVDDGAIGFQGVGVDRKVAGGTWVASENGWVFDRVFEAVRAEGTRFFVTVSTVNSPTDRATIQLRIPGHQDAFTPMSYDRGDRGVFLRTARIAPLLPVIAAATHTISRKAADDLPPLVRITAVVGPQGSFPMTPGVLVLHGDWMVVRGIARDLGGSVPSRVRVGLNRVGRATTWVDATPEVAGFATWEARFFELPRPQAYELRVQGEDWVGNRSAVSTPVTVELK